MKQTTRERLEAAAAVLRVIEAQQEAQPGYCQETAIAIVNSELKRLEREEENR